VGEEVEQQAVDFVGSLKLHPVASVLDPFVSQRARHVLLRFGHLSLSEGHVTTALHTERRGLDRRQFGGGGDEALGWRFARYQLRPEARSKRPGRLQLRDYSLGIRVRSTRSEVSPSVFGQPLLGDPLGLEG
jgi:hypothetical protein